MKRTMTLLLLAVVLAAATCMSPVALAVNNGAPAQTQRSGLCGERRSKEAGVVLAARQERSLADFATTSYPSAVEKSEDGSKIRKVYDLEPGQDPAGIPRSDFEQNGIHYTLTDLLKQEMPEYQERQHIEEVSLESKDKDMASILALLPQQREFVTEDGLSGTLTLQLDTVQVETAGYGKSTRTVTTTRRYPNLGSQDTSYIPKTVEENGRTMTLQDISWQTDNTANMDDYALGDRYTAVATYSGTATSSYVTGYTVTAKYEGTVSKIALNRVRYVAIFEGTEIKPVVTLPEIEDPAAMPDKAGADGGFSFNWGYILIPLGVVVLIGGGVGAALFLKKRHESREESV